MNERCHPDENVRSLLRGETPHESDDRRCVRNFKQRVQATRIVASGVELGIHPVGYQMHSAFRYSERERVHAGGFADDRQVCRRQPRDLEIERGDAAPVNRRKGRYARQGRYETREQMRIRQMRVNDLDLVDSHERCRQLQRFPLRMILHRRDIYDRARVAQRLRELALERTQAHDGKSVPRQALDEPRHAHFHAADDRVADYLQDGDRLRAVHRASLSRSQADAVPLMTRSISSFERFTARSNSRASEMAVAICSPEHGKKRSLPNCNSDGPSTATALCSTSWR